MKERGDEGKRGANYEINKTNKTKSGNLLLWTCWCSPLEINSTFDSLWQIDHLYSTYQRKHLYQGSVQHFKLKLKINNKNLTTKL